MEKLEEWNEHVGISWWKDSRIKLNKVIRKFNEWVDFHQTDNKKSTKLLTKIEKHLNMDYPNQDGGGGYKDCLLKMKYNVITTNKIKNKL